MSNTLFEFKISKMIKIEKLNIELIYISKAKYEDDWHSTMHSHTFAEMFYVLKGNGIFKIEQSNFNVKENDLVIVNPHVVHTESSNGLNPLEYIVIGIDGLSLVTDNTDDSNALQYNIYNYSKYKEEVLSYMNNLLYEVQQKDEYYESICQNILEALIFNVKRRAKSPLVPSPTKSINKECAFIKDYLDIHYSSELNLDYLAEVTHMNKYYLIHVFKKVIGTSPIEYLIEKRISIAKMLLETTEYSIEQISGISGFSSQSYFNQTFKKRVGITPSKYRNQYTANKKS